MPRKTFEIPGVDHGSTPIPMAAMIGNTFRSSGIPPTTAATGEISADGAEQVVAVFANAKALLGVAGLSPANVVYMDIFLQDNSLRPNINKQWLDWYPDENRPARHITVRELPGKYLIQLQIHAVAELPAQRHRP